MRLLPWAASSSWQLAHFAPSTTVRRGSATPPLSATYVIGLIAPNRKASPPGSVPLR